MCKSLASSQQLVSSVCIIFLISSCPGNFANRFCCCNLVLTSYSKLSGMTHIVFLLLFSDWCSLYARLSRSGVIMLWQECSVVRA
jgi:hypothetical protein